VQQEGEEQVIRLGEIEPSLEGASGSPRSPSASRALASSKKAAISQT